jgi:methylmalonyl-CoA/ethylmalonyl-CoA epimerase
MSINPNEIFRRPIQIGMVVDDLETAMKKLENILGIGPFRVVDFPPTGNDDIMMKYKGQDKKFTAKFCFFDLGNTELEIIQPLTGRSIWRDHIDKHGPGLHHIKFSVPEHEPVKDHFDKQGIEISQMGASVGKNTGKTRVFYDTDDKVGFAVEVMNEIFKKTDMK